MTDYKEIKSKKLSDLTDRKSEVIEIIRYTIDEVRDLPTLPSIARETRRLVDDQSSTMSDLVDIIEKDIALSGRILRIANSAYYGVPRKIDNLKMAMVILGMNEINNLVMTVAIMRLFPSSKGRVSFNMSKFWEHSASCAELTTGLYIALRQPCPSGAYIAGLFHDVGKLFLDQYFHKYFMECMAFAKKNNLSLSDSELHLIGVDHGVIGSWLVRKWNIPDEIGNAIAYHHFRPGTEKKNKLAEMIDWADRLSYLLDERSEEEVIQILETHTGWQYLHSNKGVPLLRMIPFLKQRIERSIRLYKILK